MMQNSRRDFLRLAGAASTLAAASGFAFPALAQATPRVVVIGGGFGGATAAKYLRRIDPRIEVTLIDRDPAYVTCPFSNMVLGGLKDMADITHDRGGLAANHGVRLVRDEVNAIDTAARRVRLRGGDTLSYDRLVVAPGIDMRLDAVEGYDAAAAELAPHAWKAGPQTELLRRQLEAMEDGGVVIIAPPANPFRCPPGPYERASMIAHYLQRHKPRSKVLILDAKDGFSKQGLFLPAWEKLYPGRIEWVAAATGGKISSVDAKGRAVTTEFGRQAAAVLNFIPPQHAAKVARDADLTDEKGWCPVNPATFESTRHAAVHVIGDAIYAGAMPKSGTSANSQAKACAAAIAALLDGREPVEPSFANTCYSLVSPDYGISVTSVYRRTSEGIREVPDSGGVSPGEASDSFRRQEALHTNNWYRGIVSDSLA